MSVCVRADEQCNTIWHDSFICIFYAYSTLHTKHFKIFKAGIALISSGLIEVESIKKGATIWTETEQKGKILGVDLNSINDLDKDVAKSAVVELPIVGLPKGVELGLVPHGKLMT